MKRVLLAAAALVAATTLTAPAARADFHGLCPGSYSKVGLSAAGGTLTFTGIVNCVGATSIDITLLKLTPVVPPGTATSAPSASCTNCTTELTATGTLSGASPGVYNVAMNFTATGTYLGNPATFSPKKLGRFVYDGTRVTQVCPTVVGNKETCPA